MVNRRSINPVTISNFIESQFPLNYQDNGQQLVALTKAYYEFLELPGNPSYLMRRYYDIKDIDQTMDEFLIHFKNKYLVDIEFDTKTNIRQVVKHALDLYRSKGTPRELNLLFKLVYGEDIEIYYPSRDLMKTSDGVWHIPTYIELTPTELNKELYQKEIRGYKSGAVAFVDDIIRKVVKGAVTDVAYISAVHNNFEVGEKIVPTDGSINIDVCSTMIGSMSSFTVSDSGTGQGYSIGDRVGFISAYGSGGVLRVANVAAQGGIIDFKLLDGGYGYSTNAELTVSTVDFKVSNLQISNTYARNYIRYSELVSQQIVQLNYHAASNTFANGSIVYTYHANNLVKGTGTILNISQSNTTAGSLIVNETSGSLNGAIYTAANTANATLDIGTGYANVSPVGEFVAVGQFVTLTLNVDANIFILGERINGEPTGYYPQPGSISGVVARADGNNLIITNVSGYFKSNTSITSLTSGVNTNIVSVSVQLGVNKVNNFFYPSVGVSGGNITGYVENISKGYDAAFAMTGLTDTETVMYNTDIIGDYLNIRGNAAAYGFPANPTANLTSGNISSFFTYANVTIGRIDNIYTVNPGFDYASAPLFRAIEPKIAPYYVPDDVTLTLTDDTSFTIGERVAQTATNAKGIVQSQTNNSVKVLMLKFYPNNNFIVTTNTTTQVVGLLSGARANAAFVANNISTYSVEGGNLRANLSLGSIANSVIAFDVVASGVGYIDGEDVFLDDNNGQGIIHLGNQGKGLGYYKEKGSFLSDQKKLFDGDYWQNYSYEIISPLMRDKYDKMVQQVAHVAGTKMFGRFVQRSYDNNVSSIIKTKITVT